jgi:ATP-dependent protease ClpP protease subunit
MDRRDTEMKKIFFVFLTGIMLIGVTTTALSDTLVLKSGKNYEGKILSEEAKTVVFEVHKYGTTFKKTVKQKDIESLTKGEIVKKPKKKKVAKSAESLGDIPKPKAPEIKKYTGPTYYIIPLKGMVGKTFVASVLEESLEDAVQREPTVVVLDMDSPGGLVSEVSKLGDVLTRYNDSLRIVVFAKDAISAAAITSLAAKEIYMRPGGRFGAATAWQPGKGGMPKAIGEKFQSVWRATARGLAEIGGHSPLLGNAMIDANIELHWVLDDDGKKIIKEGPAKGKDKTWVIKKGKLLTMTSKEAVACGLAAGVAKNYKDLGKKLGYEKWEECKGLGVLLGKWQEESLKTAEKKFKKHMDKFGKSFSRAMAMDPRKGSYTVYRNSNGHLTPSSQKKWKKRTRQCNANLHQASKELKEAEGLATKFPGLLTNPDQIKNMRKQIDDMKQQIAGKYNNRGIGGR